MTTNANKLVCTGLQNKSCQPVIFPAVVETVGGGFLEVKKKKAFTRKNLVALKWKCFLLCEPKEKKQKKEVWKKEKENTAVVCVRDKQRRVKEAASSSELNPKRQIWQSIDKKSSRQMKRGPGGIVVTTTNSTEYNSALRRSHCVYPNENKLEFDQKRRVSRSIQIKLCV